MNNLDANLGYVYVLLSPNTDCIKIGGTDYPPLKRIREINTTEPYKSLGPWSLADFRQVTHWREIEYVLHYTFRSKLDTRIPSQKELFHVSIQDVTAKMNEIDPSNIIRKPKVDRLFQDDAFLYYIVKLFSFTGLLHWLDIQGAWTFVLFPKTTGGRYFTINIGQHEVAFSTLEKRGEQSVHMILMDKLILDFSNVLHWIDIHNGTISLDSYATALPRSAAVRFEGNFEDVQTFLTLDGVRRALIAYWNEALIRLKERNKLSIYAKHHDWNAVAKIQYMMKGIS
ncbi:MAG: GIY-YIG nuclease family protein [Chloroflexi bacterium SZAS-1]|nr:GIY-YIG nuclease family protein [Chloroflexi bacterium SZAS-1]